MEHWGASGVRMSYAAQAGSSSLEFMAGPCAMTSQLKSEIGLPWNAFSFTFGCVFKAVPFYFSSLALRTLVSTS